MVVAYSKSTLSNSLSIPLSAVMRGRQRPATLVSGKICRSADNDFFDRKHPPARDREATAR
jgi:hypothetical protein